MIEWMLLLAGIIEFLLPASVAVYLWKKHKINWIFFFFGVAMFLLSMVRIPLNMAVQSSLSQHLYGASLLVLAAFFPSLTAGIFEEGCRFLGYKYIFRPDNRTWKSGLMYGTGHGGIESIIISANHLLTFLFLMAAAGFLPAWYVAELQATPAYMPLVAAVERIFAFCLHLGLSVIVLQCFLRQSRKYLGYAVGLHTAANFVALLLAQKSIFLSETSVGIFALIGLYIIWKFRNES